MIEEFISNFWSTVQASSIYLLLGLGISGLVHLFLPQSILVRHFGRGKKWGILKAAILGAPLPLCSCSVLPAAISLRKKGASVGATSSFLISTPETGIDSISLTYALIDLPMTIFRPIGAIFSALIAGIGQELFNRNPPMIFDLNEKTVHQHQCCEVDHVSTTNMQKRKLGPAMVEAFKYGFFELLQDFALWILLGFILTAILTMVLPDDFFHNFGHWQSQLLVILVAIPLYICASASTPIAAALIAKGLSPGTALVFLLVGPATNLSSIVVLNKYLGSKGTIINLISIIVCALIMGFFVDWFYSQFAIIPLTQIEQVLEEGDFSFFNTLCSIALLLLVGRGIYAEHLKKWLNPNKKNCCDGETHSHTHDDNDCC